MWFWRRRQSLDARLAEEVRFHIERETSQNVLRGMSPEEAVRHAHLTFGAAEAHKEQARTEFPFAFVQEFANDARLAVRAYWRTPGFALRVIATLGLALGAATAVFTAVNDVLLRPLPYPAPDRLVRLYQLGDSGARMEFSDLNFRDIQAMNQTFTGMAALASWGRVPVTGDVEPTMTNVVLVARDFFDLFGVAPAWGRSFRPEEQQPNGERAVVVSHAFWTRAMASEESLASRRLRIGGRLYTVVGVMPDFFDYPAATAIWMPRELNSSELAEEARTAHNYHVIARVRDGVALDAARSNVRTLARELKTRHGDDTAMADVDVVRLRDEIAGSARPILYALFAGSLLLVAIGLSNVTSLMLARSVGRQHEFATRLALGGAHSRLRRQLLAEAMVLCLTSAAVAVFIALWMIGIFTAVDIRGMARLNTVRVSGVSVLFLAASAIVASVVLTLATLASVRHASSVASHTHRSTTTRRTILVRHAMLVLQVALTVALLNVTGVLERTFAALAARDPGFVVDDTLVMDVTLTNGGPNYRHEKVALLDRLIAGLSTLPGVTTVGATTGFPLGGGNYRTGQFLELTRPDEIRTHDDVNALPKQTVADRSGAAAFRVVSSDYFAAMGIPHIAGRVFEAPDGPDAPHVAVVSQSLAEARWPNRDPIGRYMYFGNMDGDARSFGVVGVVGDVLERDVAQPPRPTVYVSYRQRPNAVWGVSLIVRSTHESSSLMQPARAVVREISPELPVEFRTVRQALDLTMGTRRFALVLLALFSGAAFVISVLGLYSLVTYVVTQQAKEISIRIALGAGVADVVRGVVRRYMWLTLVGVGAGAVVCGAGAATIRAWLFNLAPLQPSVFAYVTLAIAGAGLVASSWPAWRAARTSPSSLLRT